MDRVRVMDPHLANMIAAGEVIERPSSVIKELVENSIDAGAKHIEVRIYEAGKEKIVVKDDGCGMSANDSLLAFKRHASSKLLSEYELFKIKTMGFRGEALPSIASVSKVTLITSDGEGVGSKVLIQEDVIERIDYPSNKGTTFIVEELFYNTPVRLKFLKTDNTENANSLEIMQRLAMSRCDIAFDFYIDDRCVFSTTGRNNLLEVISRIYSLDSAKKMIPIKHEDIEFSFEGFVGKPDIAKSTRYYMITILNNRNVYLPKIQKAIIEAYGDHLFSNKYPFVVLKIRVESSLVDVNVHPTKKEVRLSIEEKIAAVILSKIKEALLLDAPLAEAPLYKQKDKDIHSSSEPSFVGNKKQIETLSLFFDEEEKKEAIISRPTLEKELKVLKEDEEIILSSPSIEDFDEKISIEQNKEEIKEKVAYKIPYMEPIGQVHNTYIVCQAEDGFYLIDQHAANERINYEKFDKVLNSSISICEPLVPIVINLNPSEAMKLTFEKISMLKQIGMEVESFGMNTIKVTHIPLFVKEMNEYAYIEELLSQVINDSKINLQELRKHVISTMACKASIKAHDKLSYVEMKDLILALFKCDNPTCCPHGRPTIVHFSKYDIEKMFKRAGF